MLEHHGVRDDDEDRDRDRVDNANEDRQGTSPRDKDSDDDGTRDGAEQAGVVASFENGKLTIDLANGTSVSGQVTAATEIECENEDAEERDHRGRGRGARSSSDETEDADEDENGDEEGGEESRDCSTSDLTVGTRIHETEAKVTPSGLVFTEIEHLK